MCVDWYFATWYTMALFLFNVVCPPPVLFLCSALLCYAMHCMCLCYLENWAWLWMHPFCTISFHVFISMRSFSGEQNTIEAPSLHLFIFILFQLFFPRLSFLFLRLFGDAYFNGFKIFRIWIFRNFHGNCLPFSLTIYGTFTISFARRSLRTFSSTIAWAVYALTEMAKIQQRWTYSVFF